MLLAAYTLVVAIEYFGKLGHQAPSELTKTR